VDGLFNADPHPGNIFVSVNEELGVARPVLLDFGMVVTLPAENRLGYCELMHSLSSLSVSGVSAAIRRAGYQNTQSSAHPERDLEFFAFLLRDTVGFYRVFVENIELLLTRKKNRRTLFRARGKNNVKRPKRLIQCAGRNAPRIRCVFSSFRRFSLHFF